MSCKSPWKFFSTYPWDQNLRVETLWVPAIRREWGETDHYLTSSVLFLDMTSIPPLTHTLFSPSPHLLHALQAHANTLTYSAATARAALGPEPEDLNSASSLPAGFVLWTRSHLGRTSSLPSVVVGIWLLSWLVKFSVLLCGLGWIQSSKAESRGWSRNRGPGDHQPSESLRGWGPSVPQR